MSDDTAATTTAKTVAEDKPQVAEDKPQVAEDKPQVAEIKRSWGDVADDEEEEQRNSAASTSQEKVVSELNVEKLTLEEAHGDDKGLLDDPDDSRIQAVRFPYPFSL